MKEVLGASAPTQPTGLNMNIQLWYNEEVSQWRWTLTDENDPSMMESGNSTELRTAMEDVANTVEWVYEVPQEE